MPGRTRRGLEREQGTLEFGTDPMTIGFLPPGVMELGEMRTNHFGGTAGDCVFVRVLSASYEAVISVGESRIW